jgi:hypothetical protein
MRGHGASCWWFASGLLGSTMPNCGGAGSIGYAVVMVVDDGGYGNLAEVVGECGCLAEVG